MTILSKLLRAGEGRALKELEVFATQVGQLEPSVESLTDQQLQAKTNEFRERLDRGESLDDLAAEAFAAMREAARRVLGMRPFDVQILGGAALHQGMMVEMRTGEGKTLVSTMPAYLNALTGGNVHLITVNEYLAARDAEWMGQVHKWMGLDVGLIQSDMTPAERRVAYAANITHGTNNEFGFDYLRDNMAMRADGMVHRGYFYAIVDEVDSILVDEARTPLIISGVVGDSAKWYRDFAKIVGQLRENEHYEVDEGKRQVITTEAGVSRVESMLGIENMYDHAAVDFVHHLDVALKAKTLYHRDVEYLVVDNEVKIVDEFTGRVLDGRRYSEGLHQAIEAQEGVEIKQENQTLATITLQNYFRMYDKLSGMTGTAKTEEAELKEIYDVDVVVIPTNKPIAREDKEDLVYKTEDAKFNALIDDIVERNARKQPVLVGTVSIEKSERLANYLSRRGIDHEVLNAKQHHREAEIIAQAGRPGAVTVATNMAGRGVDIMLGGNPDGLALAAVRKTGLSPDDEGFDEAYATALEKYTAETAAAKEEVLAAGGLYVIGTERHDSRRIDNQLRGRSGRQGDPGESRFYLSLEDDLMRRFAGERVTNIMDRLKLPEDVPIEAKMVSKSVERAQGQVEAQNFEARKNVLKYDEVMNRQREVIYAWRQNLLLGEESADLARDWIDEAIEGTIRGELEMAPAGQWDLDDLMRELTVLYPATVTPADLEGVRSIEKVVDVILEDAHAVYDAREAELGADVLRSIEKRVTLSIIDNKWREHLSEMDYLRAGIGLRAMGQRDPLVEYQNEAYNLFAGLVESVKRDAVRYLYHVEVVDQTTQQPQRVQADSSKTGPSKPKRATAEERIGRNEPCHCGSGKKYKKCHGAAE